MPKRIRKLSISNFRGASQTLDLELKDKPVTLIFGENGSGKSTIVDALECVGNGSTAFMDDWKLGKGKRKESFIPTLGKDVTDVSIQLEFGDQLYKASLNKKGLALCNTEDRPVIKVLRRKSLQAFIEADPAQRYREVANFLDIPQIEKSEDTLRQALKDAKNRFEFATNDLRQAKENMQGIWEAEGSPGLNKKYKEAESWARDEANVNADAIGKEIVSLNEDLQKLSRLDEAVKAYSAANEEVKDAKAALGKAVEQLKKAEASATAGNADLVTLLQDAKTYLSSNEDAVCPVCEVTQIDAKQLVTRLGQRIAAMNELKQANDVKNRKLKAHEAVLGQLEKTKLTLLQTGETAATRFSGQYQQFSNFAQIKENKPEEALKLVFDLHQILLPVQADTQKSQQLKQKQLHTLNTIKQLVKTLDTKTVEAQQGEKLQERLTLALDIVEKKRKVYVEKILTEIGQTVDELYQQIHPDEDIGQLRLKLDENQRGSLLYGVAFGTQKDLHPQPYYSESHLDTLGLCIFIALALRSTNSRKIVVLDDVLGSVDQQHLNRSIDMILKAASGFSQTIITSHYRPLRNRFLNSRTGSNEVQLLDLRQWLLDKGISFSSPKLAIEKLAALLKEEDVPRSYLAIDAGTLLENMFDYITLLYGTRMRRQVEPLYTLHELYSSVRGIKDWKIITNSTETELKPLLDALNDKLPVRNEAGAHYNVNGELLSDDEIKAFAQLALDLATTITCGNCAGMPERQDKQAGNWACQCKATRMLPFQI